MTQHIVEYITERNWMAILKRHMDAIDEITTFNNHPENSKKFTNFIHKAFKLLVQESLLDKDVIDDIKKLNHLTVDMEIFVADGSNILSQLDVRSMLQLDS
jgi:hypothetical protein